MKKKRFIVEIEIPDNTGDLCWDLDETGWQAFHDCIEAELPVISLEALVNAQNKDELFKDFIDRQNKIRSSFKVISSIGDPQEISDQIDKAYKEYLEYPTIEAQETQEANRQTMWCFKCQENVPVIQQKDCAPCPKCGYKMPAEHQTTGLIKPV